MSTAYGYARISHHDGFKEGDSINSQKMRIEGYYKMMLEASGVTFGGVHTDGKNCSASKVNFYQRPAGKALVAIMQPGDHFIIDKLDRLWRSLEDFCRLMRWFKSQRIQVHIVDMRGCSVQMGTPMGDFMLQMMVSIAQLEASMISSRTKQALEAKRKAGVEPQAFRGWGPFGIDVTGKKGDRKLHWNWEKRKIARDLIDWWFSDYRTAKEIDDRCFQYVHLLESRQRGMSKFTFGNGFRRLMKPELTFQIMRIEDPNQLRNPKEYNDFMTIGEGMSCARPDLARAMLQSTSREEALLIASRRKIKRRAKKADEPSPLAF
jgi:DNA invertase Pin-like site-specific DNA recombinase